MATIQKRGKKYQVLVRRKGFPTACRTFHLKSDAEQWARHMETKADRGELPAPSKELEALKVRDVLERYRDEVTVKKRGAKYEWYVINSLMKEPFADISLAQINTGHFAKYRDERLRFVSPATVNRQLGIVRHAFEIAKDEWEMPVKANPLAKLKKLVVNDARDRRLRLGEYQALEQAAHVCRNPLVLPMIKLAIETGMRQGELLSLEWQNINLLSKVAFIPVTKNGYSRTIPLTSEALTILVEIQNKKMNEKFVFAGLTGSAIQQAWERLIQRAKIENLRFHDLRHEAISRFFEKGLSIPEVALISGHRDYRMLFRYTHLRAEDVAAKLNS